MGYSSDEELHRAAREWRDENPIDDPHAPPRPRPRECRLGRVSLAEISTRKIVPPDFVVDDWMVAREQSFLAGESQSGKSFLALHAGMCVATGREVLGKKTAQGLVIYQAGESGFGVTGLRIPAWLQHYGEGVDPTEVPFEILPARVNLFREGGNAAEFHEAIANIAREWEDKFPLKLVVIDTMSKAMAGANENDGRDVGRVLEHCERISRATGAHVCVVHHLPKNGVGMRGHGSLKGDTDSVVMVKKGEKGVRIVEFDKVKDGEAGGKMHFELMQVELGKRDDGKPITSCVVLPVGEKDAARKAEEAKGFALRPKEEPIFRALMEAQKKAGRFATAEMEDAGVPSGMVAVHYEDWREAYKGETIGGDGGEPKSNDAIRKDFERYREGLIKFGIIGWKRPWVWATGKRVRGFFQPGKSDNARTEAGSVTGEAGTDGGLTFSL